MAPHAPYERQRTIVESPVHVILMDALDDWGCHSSRWKRGRTIGHVTGEPGFAAMKSIGFVVDFTFTPVTEGIHRASFTGHIRRR
jgi:hypothetical protein